MVGQGEWNIGGERIWLAPEIKYMVRDRADLTGTYSLPPAIDPGNWTLEGDSQKGSIKLSQELNLTAFGTPKPITKKLYLERRLRSTPDPLRTIQNYAGLMEGIIYTGYEHTVSLSDWTETNTLSAAWSLIQLNPDGRVIVPVTSSFQPVIYFPSQEPGSELMQVKDNCILLTISGRNRYKVGLSSVYVTGRLGYINLTSEDYGYLLIRNYHNNPSEEYIEEPPFLSGYRGDSAHVFNDDGALGGFGELECQCRAVGNNIGRRKVEDVLTLWVYSGYFAKLKVVAKYLLGVDLSVNN
jgi:hypothetical protein